MSIRFYIASTTKAFTAMSVALLAADNQLALRDPVRKRVPEFVFYDAYTSNEVTWIDLLSHRTGVADSEDLNSAVTRHDLLLAQAERKPALPFRTGWHYCNELYAVVGRLIELVAGCRWEDFVDQRIFQPLGMRGCDFAWLHRIGDDAVIVLANKPGPLPRVITYTVCDHLLGCQPTDWAAPHGFAAG